MNKRQTKKQQKRAEQLGKAIIELSQNDYIMENYKEIRICYHKRKKVFLVLRQKNTNDFIVIPNKNLNKLIKKFKKSIDKK